MSPEKELTSKAYWKSLGQVLMVLIVIVAGSFFFLRMGVNNLVTLGVKDTQRTDFGGLGLLEGLVNAVPNVYATMLGRFLWRKGQGNHNVWVVLIVICFYIPVIWLADMTFGIAFPRASSLENRFFFKWWMLVVFTGMTALVGTIFQRQIIRSRQTILSKPVESQFEL